VAIVDSYLNDAAAVAFAASAFVRVATTDLEVYGRAVTLRGRGGELCSQGGWSDLKSQKPTLQATSLRPITGPTVAVMPNVRNFTSRIGSNAFSGTG
jgi:hypothetical protein